MNKWINPNFTSRLALMRKQFSAGKPFPHLMISDFLDEDKARELATALKREKFVKKEADLFQFSQTEDFKHSKNAVIKDFYKFVSSDEFSDLMSELTSLNLESGAIDLAGSLYEDTDYLLCHDDQLEDRKVAYILYLGEDFFEKDGGAFALLSNNKGRAGEIVEKHFPRYNGLMVFQVSKISFHQVEEVLSSKKRYAIGGWLH